MSFRQRLIILHAAAFIVIAILFVFGSTSANASHVFANWSFDNFEELSGWQTLDVNSMRIEGGVLIISAGKAPRIGISSIRPFSGPVLAVLRLKTSRQGQGTIFISVSSKELLEKQFTISEYSEFTEVQVYIGRLLKAGNSIKGFAIEFPGETGDIQIDGIQFREATVIERASVVISKFLEFEGINIITINNIDTPQIGQISFTVALIVLTVISVFVLSILWKVPLVKAVAWSFFVSALIFTARMDYNWAQVWRNNTLLLSDMNMDERISFLYKGSIDEFHHFLIKIKIAAPEGEAVRPATREFDNYLAKIARYYLLPVRSSGCGRYLWIYNEDTYFDPGSMSLMKKDKIVAAQVYPVFLDGDNGLFRLTGDDSGCK